MPEYGLFSDEGCVEAQLYSLAEARAAFFDRYSDEDKLYIGVMCPEHDEQEWDDCEECCAEDAE